MFLCYLIIGTVVYMIQLVWSTVMERKSGSVMEGATLLAGDSCGSYN